MQPTEITVSPYAFRYDRSTLLLKKKKTLFQQSCQHSVSVNILYWSSFDQIQALYEYDERACNGMAQRWRTSYACHKAINCNGHVQNYCKCLRWSSENATTNRYQCPLHDGNYGMSHRSYTLKELQLEAPSLSTLISILQYRISLRLSA